MKKNFQTNERENNPLHTAYDASNPRGHLKRHYAGTETHKGSLREAGTMICKEIKGIMKREQLLLEE